MKYQPESEPRYGVAVLRHDPMTSSHPKVSGTVHFEDTGEGLKIDYEIRGLYNGLHGFHIHEYGDLTDGCTSACAHFNPDDETHGGLDSETRHMGDLGNISSKDRVSKGSLFLPEAKLDSSKYGVLGRMVIVHADEDDLGKGGDEESLKTGNAGKRLACGVIGLSEPPQENKDAEDWLPEGNWVDLGYDNAPTTEQLKSQIEAGDHDDPYGNLGCPNCGNVDLFWKKTTSKGKTFRCLSCEWSDNYETVKSQGDITLQKFGLTVDCPLCNETISAYNRASIDSHFRKHKKEAAEAAEASKPKVSEAEWDMNINWNSRCPKCGKSADNPVRTKEYDGYVRTTYYCDCDVGQPDPDFENRFIREYLRWFDSSGSGDPNQVLYGDTTVSPPCMGHSDLFPGDSSFIGYDVEAIEHLEEWLERRHGLRVSLPRPEPEQTLGPDDIWLEVYSKPSSSKPSGDAGETTCAKCVEKLMSGATYRRGYRPKAMIRLSDWKNDDWDKTVELSSVSMKSEWQEEVEWNDKPKKKTEPEWEDVEWEAEDNYDSTYGKAQAKIRRKLKNKIKKQAIMGTKAGQWSARKSQELKRQYEAACSKKGLQPYKGSKTKKQQDLSDWSKQKWKTASGKKSSITGEPYFPAKAVAALKQKNLYAKAKRQKAAATKAGKQNARYSDDIRAVVKQFRAEDSGSPTPTQLLNWLSSRSWSDRETPKTITTEKPFWSIKQPTKCIWCNSGDLSEGDVPEHEDGGIIYSYVGCNDCGCVWREEYRYVGDEVIEEGESRILKSEDEQLQIEIEGIDETYGLVPTDPEMLSLAESAVSQYLSRTDLPETFQLHTNPHFVFVSPDAFGRSSHVARFRSQTSSHIPIIMLSSEAIRESADDYGVSLKTAVETTVWHELGHVLCELWDMEEIYPFESSNDEEEFAESIAESMYFQEPFQNPVV